MPKIVPNLIAQPVSRGQGAPQWGAPQISGGDPSGIAREIQQTGQQIGATSDAVAQWQAMRDETNFAKYQIGVGAIIDDHFNKVSELGFEDYEKQRETLKSEYNLKIDELQGRMGLYGTRIDVFNLKTLADAEQKEEAYYITQEGKYMFDTNNVWIDNVVAKGGTFMYSYDAQKYWEETLPKVKGALAVMHPGNSALQEQELDKRTAKYFGEVIFSMVENKNFDEAKALLTRTTVDANGEELKKGGHDAFLDKFSGGREIIDGAALAKFRNLVDEGQNGEIVAAKVWEISRLMHPLDGSAGITEQEGVALIAGMLERKEISYVQAVAIQDGLRKARSDRDYEDKKAKEERVHAFDGALLPRLYDGTMTEDDFKNPVFSEMSIERQNFYRKGLAAMKEGSVIPDGETYNKFLYSLIYAVSNDPSMGPTELSQIEELIGGQKRSVFNLKKEDVKKLFDLAQSNKDGVDPANRVIAVALSRNGLDKDPVAKEVATNFYGQYLWGTGVSHKDPAMLDMLQRELDATMKAYKDSKGKLPNDYVQGRVDLYTQGLVDASAGVGAMKRTLGMPSFSLPVDEILLRGAQNGYRGDQALDVYAQAQGHISTRFEPQRGMIHLQKVKPEIDSAGLSTGLDPNLLAALTDAVAKNDAIKQVVTNEGRVGKLGLRNDNVNYNGMVLSSSSDEGAYLIMALSIKDKLPLRMPDGTMANAGATISSALRAVFMEEYGMTEAQAQSLIEDTRAVYDAMRAWTPLSDPFNYSEYNTIAGGADGDYNW